MASARHPSEEALRRAMLIYILDHGGSVRSRKAIPDLARKFDLHGARGWAGCCHSIRRAQLAVGLMEPQLKSGHGQWQLTVRGLHEARRAKRSERRQ